MHYTNEELFKDVRTVAYPWRYSNHPYYAEAEKATHLFWNSDSEFRKVFNQLNLCNVVELACGQGRHAEISSNFCESLTLLDIFRLNLDVCRQRLGKKSNVHYLLGNGYNFYGISDASVTAIYSYDAMVHFAPSMVKSYLIDAARILVPGGRFLAHHSNYSANPEALDIYKNPHGRNHMSYEIIISFAEEAKLKILESFIITGWGGGLDRITLFEKPTNK